MESSGSSRSRGLLFIPTLLCLVLPTSGCVKEPVVVCHPNYFQTLEGEAIAWKTLRLEILLAEDPDNVKLSTQYFYLALLHAHPDNPEPDYDRALHMFDKYLSFNPRSGRKDEARYVRNLLQKLSESYRERGLMQADADRERTRLQEEAGQLKRQNSRLKKANELLAAEKKELTDAIERLKQLEHSLEEKRMRR